MGTRKLGRTTDHRLSMLKSLTTSLLLHGRIETTEAKAKEVRSLVEKLITLGIKEQLIFPEINYDEILKLRGMDIVFVTTAKTNEEAFELLSGFGMPFRK